MALSRLTNLFIFKGGVINCSLNYLKMVRRHKTHFRTGAVKPMPPTMPFGIVGVFCAVIPGLFIGAAISKTVANFLEENDLFVPSDDDDDDD